MACGGCSRRHRPAPINKDGIMGGYKYLTDAQIKARLEVYKKRYCSECNNRYKCDYTMYVNCKNPSN